nr:MAG: hypothetical protein [Bacteriophage sp.]
MDKITFREIGVNNIDKYVGKECKIAGKKYIIVGHTADHPLFILTAVNPEDGIWNDDHAINYGFSVFDKNDVVLKKIPKGTTYIYSYYVFM